jgi:hypothetical protein
MSIKVQRGGYPCKFRVQNREKVALEVAGASFGRGCLYFDEVFYVVIIEVVSTPLRD